MKNTSSFKKTLSLADKSKLENINSTISLITKNDLKNLEDVILQKIDKTVYLQKAAFEVKILKNHLYVQYLEISEDVPQSYLALVITQTKKYFVVVSPIHLSGLLDKEPYFSSIQENEYQKQIADLFQIDSLHAYDLGENKSIDWIIDNEGELLYFEGKKYSFLLYPLS